MRSLYLMAVLFIFAGTFISSGWAPPPVRASNLLALENQNPGPLENQNLRPLENQNLRPDEIIVIANSASRESIAVAKYYMEKRNIPKEHLFRVHFPNLKHRRPISHRDFQEKMVAPLKHFLEAAGLKEKILCFVTVYDVPYKVAAPADTTGFLKKRLKKKTNELRAMRLDFTAEHPDILRLKEAVKKLESQLEVAESIWKELARKLPSDQRKRVKQIFSGLASVDSELAWLYRSDVYKKGVDGMNRARPYYGRSHNLYFSQNMKFRQFRHALKKQGLLEKWGLFYMTARLEAPSVAISKRLVDLAIQAETEGARGIGCFDAKKKTIGRIKQGYDLGEAWVRRAYIETINAGFEAKFDEEKAIFDKGSCPDTLFYWGWYALSHYKDAFQSRFAPGAFAVHTASGEASNIRRFEAGGRYPWCAGLLAHGVAFCSGPIAEPFLDAFPHADTFFPRIFGGWSAAEAYWAAEAYNSWMMVMIGDPLYAPFSGKNRLKNYVRGGVVFKDENGRRIEGPLVNNTEYQIDLFLAAQNPIFRRKHDYRVSNVQVSRPKNFELKGLDAIRFEMRSGGRLLNITGLRFALKKTGKLKNGELAVTIDLGADGGKKMISQIFWINATLD